MGKGKKGKKGKKSEEKKEKILLKKEKQILKSLRKEQSKKKKELNNFGDVDIDSFDMNCRNESVEKKYKHINISNTPNNSFVECEKPDPRHHCSITFINDEECVLFGGENKENNESITYNDLFKYNVVKDTWKYYFTVDKKPKPRTSHQTVYYHKKLYIFGGELNVSGQFFHFNDLWCFDLKTNKFEEILMNDKKDEKPSPRSGHKMILWKKCFILFGGFFDNGKYTEYFNDLYLYIINANKWINLTNIYKDHLFHTITGANDRKDSILQKEGGGTIGKGRIAAKVEEEDENENENEIMNKDRKWKKNSSNNTINTINTINTKNIGNMSNDLLIAKSTALLKARFLKIFDFSSYMPSKRSNVALFTDTKFQNIYIYGGYAKIKSSLQIEVGEYYNDMWVVNLQFPNEEKISVSFKKLKKSIFQPSKRIGFATCVYKNSVILFGGVYDQIERIGKRGAGNIEDEGAIKESSLFFNDLYVFDMSNEHWSRLHLKTKGSGKSVLLGNCRKGTEEKKNVALGVKNEKENEHDTEQEEGTDTDVDADADADADGNEKDEKKKRLNKERKEKATSTPRFRGKRTNCKFENEQDNEQNDECFVERDTDDKIDVKGRNGKKMRNELQAGCQTDMLVYFDERGNKRMMKIKGDRETKKRKYNEEENEKKEDDTVISPISFLRMNKSTETERGLGGENMGHVNNLKILENWKSEEEKKKKEEYADREEYQDGEEYPDEEEYANGEEYQDEEEYPNGEQEKGIVLAKVAVAEEVNVTNEVITNDMCTDHRSEQQKTKNEEREHSSFLSEVSEMGDVVKTETEINDYKNSNIGKHRYRSNSTMEEFNKTTISPKEGDEDRKTESEGKKKQKKKQKQKQKEKEKQKEKKKTKKIVMNTVEEPIGRINCHIFLINKYLYVYGGMYEYMNSPIILGDLWKIDIDKREKWEIIDKGNLDNIYLEELSGEDSDDDDDDDDSLFDSDSETDSETDNETNNEFDKKHSNECDNESDIESNNESYNESDKELCDVVDRKNKKKRGRISKTKKETNVSTSNSTSSISDDDKEEEEEEEEEEERELERSIITNKIKRLKEKMEKENRELGLTPEENLNDFFNRTKDYWILQTGNDIKGQDAKEIRKCAFNLCKEKHELLKKYFKRIEKLKCFLLESCNTDSEEETEESEKGKE